MQKIKGEQQDEEPSEKPEAKQLTPREALERIHAARVKPFTAFCLT